MHALIKFVKNRRLVLALKLLVKTNGVDRHICNKPISFSKTQIKIASSLAQEKLASLNALLAQRIKKIQRELQDLELQTAAEFVVVSSITITAASLKHHLTTLQKNL
jgi:hypothetical protein